MATILMAWELGTGIGHMTPMRAIADELIALGHDVHAALRELDRADEVFAGSKTNLRQAPAKFKPTPGLPQDIVSYAHILRNTSFGDLAELTTLANAWRSMLEELKPRIVLFDHSPTALLASRGLPIKRVMLGTGFQYPPDVAPLPDLRPWLKTDPETLRKDEASVLNHANAVLNRWAVEPMERLAQLYHPNDGAFLFSLACLDPFPRNENITFLDTVTTSSGGAPHWPPGDGPRVFAYLKPFDSMPVLLQVLQQFAARAIIFAPTVKPELKAKHAQPSIQFVDEPVDLAQVANACDLAILNGTNGTIAHMLRAGVPMLNIPLNLEQDYNARAIEKLGAGLTAAPNRPAQLVSKLADLLESGTCREGAAAFPANHPVTTVGITPLVERLRELL